VAAQQADPSSQLNYVAALLKLRATSDALGNKSEWKFLSDPTAPYPMVYGGSRAASNTSLPSIRLTGTCRG
jgi:hypothetical protein